MPDYFQKNHVTLTIKEFAVKHRHAGHAADELEVGQVVLVT